MGGMSHAVRASTLVSILTVLAACGGGAEQGTGGHGTTSTGGAGGGGAGAGGSGGGGLSGVQHLVVIIQENHTFDDHFGRYCQAAAGSAPACNQGPGCCERGPDTDPSGAAPTILSDTAHGDFSPNHAQVCELEEIGGGAMDGFVTGSGGCGDARNFAYAEPALVQPYWDRAAQGALGDRYFQPIAGASSSNDMYLARAQYVFTDNDFEPKGSVGVGCVGGLLMSYADPTIGDLLDAAAVPWAFYAEGYQAAKGLGASCPPGPPAACPAGVTAYPCVFDPGDVPFQYYSSLVDRPASMRDLQAFHADLAAGALPAVSYLKLIGYKTEHPGGGTRLSTGVAAATALIDAVLAGPQAAQTLVLLVYDEGGGYFDHVAPPPDSPVDHQPYGTRLPFLALGRFARKNWVSHLTMEHSSIVRFIEWNWLGGQTGQLGGRDAVVNGLGSLLDPAVTSVVVPD